MSECRSCKAEIIWALSVKRDAKTGRRRRMPVVPRSDGNLVIDHEEGDQLVLRVLKKGEVPDALARRFLNHFAECPKAKKHRRR